MKNLCIVLLALIILSCGEAPTVTTGGTSIEVAMIKGVVVDVQNRPVKGAAVTFISQSPIPDSTLKPIADSIKSDVNGAFSEKVAYRGAISVVIKDTSGNGAFKPCTLTTNSIVDLDTIKLEKLGTLEIRLDLSKFDTLEQYDFYVWTKELCSFYSFDSTDWYSELPIKKDTTFTINIEIPAGEYNFEMSPRDIADLKYFFILDTTIVMRAGEKSNLVFSPSPINHDLISKSLREEFAIVHDFYTLNNLIDTGSIPWGVGIRNDHITQLVVPNKIDTIPSSIGTLYQLEEIQLWECPKVSKIPSSIGQLQNLCIFLMGECSKITELPNEMSYLKKLKIFGMDGCTSQKRLPEVLYRMPALEKAAFDFYWLPSQREKEWALKNMFHGNSDSLAVWEADLISKYGKK